MCEVMREEFKQILKAINDIPQPEFSKIWDDDLKEFDRVGPTIEELLLYCKRFFFQNSPPKTEKVNNFDQKFTSGFFIS